jgi:hypothetical protein
MDELNNGIDEVSYDDVDIEDAELRHANRHLHKGEDVARFTDRDDDDDEP